MIARRKKDRVSASYRRFFSAAITYIMVGFCLLGGRVMAQQNRNPSEVDLTGDWVGTITHANDTYSYTYEYVLRLKQVGTTVSGTSHAETGNVSVSFEVKGQYSKDKLRVKDGKMISSQDSNPNNLWCIKSIELNVVEDGALRLEGSWKSKSQFDFFKSLGSVNPRSTLRCVGGTISLTQENLPAPFTDTANYGTTAYYDFRNNDYIKRNPRKSPPTYYMNFGKRYLDIFMTELYPNLSPEGKAFLNRVGILLQTKIEDRLNSNPKSFAELEDTSEAFLNFAYNTHYPAYCEAGWGSLSLNDQQKIIRVIELRDLWRVRGVAVKLLNCSGYKKPVAPQKPSPVKTRLKNIWDQIKQP